MRSYHGIRSTLVGALIALGSMIAFTAPAAAETGPLDMGVYAPLSVDDLDLAHIGDVLADPVAVVPQHLEQTSVIAVAGFDPLKPEYAESYETHGLVFIDLHRRC